MMKLELLPNQYFEAGYATGVEPGRTHNYWPMSSSPAGTNMFVSLDKTLSLNCLVDPSDIGELFLGNFTTYMLIECAHGPVHCHPS